MINDCYTTLKCFGNYSWENRSCDFCLAADKEIGLACKLITPSPGWKLKLNDFLFMQNVSCPFATFKGFNKNNTARIQCISKKGPCEQDPKCLAKILEKLKESNFF